MDDYYTFTANVTFPDDWHGPGGAGRVVDNAFRTIQQTQEDPSEENIASLRSASKEIEHIA